MAKITNQSERKMKGYWPAIAVFALIIFVAMSVFDMDFGSNQSNACNCEEELYIWASGGNTFNTTLKVDCLEKYNGPDYMHVYTKMKGPEWNITFMQAWDKAKKECESN